MRDEGGSAAGPGTGAGGPTQPRRLCPLRMPPPCLPPPPPLWGPERFKSRSGAFCRAVLRCGYYYYYFLKLQLCCRFALDVQAAVRRRGGIAQPGVPARPQAPEGCSPWVLAHGWGGAGRAPAGSALRDENKSNCSA